MSRLLARAMHSSPADPASARVIHDLFARVVDAVEEGIIGADLDGTITTWNRAAERIYGYAADEIIGQNVRVLPPPDRRDEPMDLIARIAAGEPTISVETQRATRSGGAVECSLTCLPITGLQGQIVGVCAVVRDLTASRQLSRTLVERDTQFKGLLDQVISGVFIASSSGHVRYVNEGFTSLFGYATTDVIDHPLSEFVAVADQGRVFEAVRAVLGGSARTVEAHVISRDKGLRSVLAQATQVQYEGQAALLGVVIDITGHRKTEAALQRANRLLRTLGAGNEALVRADSEQALMQTMCNVLVTVGEARAVAIGLQDASGVLQIAAVAGSTPDATSRLGPWRDAPGGDEIPAGVTRTGEPRFDGTDAWFPLAHHGRTLGCLFLQVEESDPLGADDIALLTELTDDLAYGIVALRRQADRETSLERLQRSMEDTIAALAATLEMRDPYTAGHQRHVSELAAAIARELGLDDSHVQAIRLASIVHDIGKIKIPSELLTKPGALTAVEEQLLQTHAEAGYEILKGIDFPWPIAEIVRQHHERLDGSGYPRGLTDRGILPEARILGVADVVEAMSADRPYRFGMGTGAALEVIEAERGVRYDADVVDACLALFREDRFTFSRPPVAQERAFAHR